MLEKYINNKVIKEIMDWFLALGFAILIFLLIQSYVFKNAKVEGVSMKPTLFDGEYVIINRFNYLINEPEYNDIVAFPYPQDRKLKYIKRIIGMPNDTVNIIDGEVYVNDELVENNFSNFKTLSKDVEYPVIVPEDCYFVLGDNRNESHDSRSSDVGFINKKDLMGRIRTRLWPLNRFGAIDKF